MWHRVIEAELQELRATLAKPEINTSEQIERHFSLLVMLELAPNIIKTLDPSQQLGFLIYAEKYASIKVANMNRTFSPSIKPEISQDEEKNCKECY